MNQSKLQTRKGLLTLLLLAALGVALMPLEAWAQAQENRIGFVIATKGSTSIFPKSAVARPVSLRQGVFPGDTLVTGSNSVIKVLFDDNTLLSVSENTQIEITKQIYDQRRAKRTTIFTMALGRVKALVAEFYAATDSRFEIHTPSAVAAARGTEFVVWTFESGVTQRFRVAQTEARIIRVQQKGQTVTGVAVISGSVQVTNPLGQSTIVSAGNFTVSPSAAPPSTPAPIATSAQAQAEVKAADVKADPTVEAQVNLQMAEQEEAAEQEIAAAEEAPVVEEAAPAAEVAAAEAGVAAIPTDVAVAGEVIQAAPPGVSIPQGTTNVPCKVIGASGNLPLGCTL